MPRLTPAWVPGLMGQVGQQRLFLIDAFGFIFAAYHARARSGALPCGPARAIPPRRVYIFNSMLRKAAKQ